MDKVLSGLEILSKVFDQQSAFMVSKMIQQVQVLFAFFKSVWLCVSLFAQSQNLTLLFIILYPITNCFFFIIFSLTFSHTCKSLGNFLTLNSVVIKALIIQLLPDHSQNYYICQPVKLRIARLWCALRFVSEKIECES